jgi:hypothetical protein
MALERIVKLKTPLTGTFEREVNSQKQVPIPSQLRNIYMLRQEKDDFQDCIFYVKKGDSPVIAILTDEPEKSEYPTFRLLKPTSQGRIRLSFEDVPKKVLFIGYGDYVEITDAA